MATLNQTVKRKKKRNDGRDEVRLKGTRDGGWIAEPVPFGAPFFLSVNQLADEYGVDSPEAPTLDEATAQRLSAIQAHRKTAESAFAYYREPPAGERSPLDDDEEYVT